MITLKEAEQNLGCRVVYTPYRGTTEEGVITGVSVAGDWVMVRFGSDTHSKATARGALDFIGGAS